MNRSEKPAWQPENGDQYFHEARHYDALYAGKAPNDLPLYLELAQAPPGAVLELGAGTGRVALPLARAGYSVTALDVSSAMLKVLRRRLAEEAPEVRGRISIAEGSMDSFGLDTPFSLVIAPFRAFQHLLTVEAQMACLERVRDHLADGGVYLHNVFNPDLALIMDKVRRGKVWEADLEYADEETGRVVRRSNQLAYDLAEQVIDIRWRFETFDRHGRLLETQYEPMRLRWQFRFEAEHLLELCGFEIVESYGGYDKRPLDDKATELIFVCKKK